tara:strand:+ start:83 stop:565 length:483 start_codon:yes stop_codon:yes gene_type:complete
MKNIFTLMALFVALTISAQAQKLGHVETQALLETLFVNSDIQANLQKMELEYQGTIQELVTKIQNLEVELQNTNLTEGQRIDKENQIKLEYENYQSQLQYADQDLQGYLQQENDKLAKQIIDAVDAVGKERGYTYIFSSDAIIYSNGDNLTEFVKTKLGL